MAAEARRFELALALYWAAVLAPRLERESRLQAQVLAQSQATLLSQALSAADPDERARWAATEARLLVFWPEVPEPALALDELGALVPAPEAASEALAAAALETDFDRRRGLLLRAEGALRDQQALLPLAYLPLAAQVRAEVHGARVAADGTLRLDDAWVEP